MIYRGVDKPIKPFQFDQAVVDVFPDMINRSIPGYSLMVSMISVMAGQYVQAKSNVYDLGCSLGAVTFAIQRNSRDINYRIIGVDNASAMIERCKAIHFENKSEVNITFLHEDIIDTKINDASVVVMNFTLQFIPKNKRKLLIEKIYSGLLPGGILILSEKIDFENRQEKKIMMRFHHHMKQLNGYEQTEIANKRDALEKVLIPDTIEIQRQRLTEVGFTQIFNWFRCFNFVSIMAIK